MTEFKVGDTTINVSFEESDVNEIKSRTPGEDTEHLYWTTPEEYHRTGNLKRGFVIADEGSSIINDVDYAAYVELGTSKMAGHFMVIQSLNTIEEEIAKRVKAELESKKIMSDIKITCRIGI